MDSNIIYDLIVKHVAVHLPVDADALCYPTDFYMDLGASGYIVSDIIQDVVDELGGVLVLTIEQFDSITTIKSMAMIIQALTVVFSECGKEE